MSASIGRDFNHESVGFYDSFQIEDNRNEIKADSDLVLLILDYLKSNNITDSESELLILDFLKSYKIAELEKIPNNPINENLPGLNIANKIDLLNAHFFQDSKFPPINKEIFERAEQALQTMMPHTPVERIEQEKVCTACQIL